MALTGISLALVRDILRLASDSKLQCRKILSLGYPDILVPTSTIQELFGNDVAQNLQFHPDSESIARWHGIAHLTNKIVEAKHFFSLLGYELEVTDISRARGDEIILDLNEPCPRELHQRYALVMDGGTLEHCFNIGQAMKNLASMVVKDGWIFQGNPLNMFNHGFYNINPTFYFDFYRKNGFSIEFFKVVTNPHTPKIFDVPPNGKFGDIPEGCSNLLAVLRREIIDLTWPVQAKYVENPTLRG